MLKKQRGEYLRNLLDSDKKENVHTFWKTFSYMSSKHKKETSVTFHSAKDFAKFFAQVPQQAVSTLAYTDRALVVSISSK